MATFPNYLYKYPHSTNFYFRIRIPVQIAQKLCINGFTFVASLKTSDFSQARFFSISINANIKKEFKKIMNNDNLYIHAEALDEIRRSRKEKADMEQMLRQLASSQFKPENWDFRAYLKERFDVYLSMAKHAISTERKTYFDIHKFGEVSKSDIARYEEHLHESISDGNSAPVFEQLAHKSYLLSYISEYELFLKSELSDEYRTQNIENLSLNLNSDTENSFKQNEQSEEHYKLLKIPTDRPLDKTAINRFFARHGWLEFMFKKQLIDEIKNYSDSYVSFKDEEFDVKSVSIAQWRQYEQVFETYEDTLKMIAGLKRSDKQTKNKISAIKFKETYLKFIEEKNREVKSDTVAQYNTSFNFFFDVLGENYDLRKLDKKEAVRIKDIVKNKSANSEKGRNEEKLAAKTFNRYLTNFEAFLSWCDHQGLEVKKGLFVKLKLKINKSNTMQRRPYSTQEISDIKGYVPKRSNEAGTFRDDAFWFPKIALYTGMRLNEISELKVEDFKEDEGITYISLYDKRLKNANSNRKIPIHSQLVNLGLLDFVSAQRKKNNSVLFSQIRAGKSKASKDGWGEPVSRWYNRSLLKNVGINKTEEDKAGYKVDFHSLRTTFLSRCKTLGLSGYLVKQIAGHSDDDDITFGVYGSETSTKLSSMRDLIEKIDY